MTTSRRRPRPLRLLAGAAVAGTAFRAVRTLRKAATILPLRPSPTPARFPPAVRVVVPARNEEAVLDACVQALRNQDHEQSQRSGRGTEQADDAHVQIVVVDDGSTDRTGDIARSHASADPRVRVVRTEGPAPGWAGKVHALHVGVEAFGPPGTGEWLLFVDADTVLAPDVLGRLLDTAESAGADLVSVPGAPPADSSASWPALMPAGLQLISENADPEGRGRKAFAIGHCILVRRSYYDKCGGWEALAARRNEDIALATAVRDHGGVTRVVDSDNRVTTSGMDPFGHGWASFRKSFVAGTGGSAVALAGAGAGQIALSLAAPVALAMAARSGKPALAALAGAGWLSQSAAHARCARVMHTSAALAPAAPATGALFGGILIDGAIRTLRGANTWKGRR